MDKGRFRASKGFTLVELLVVIAIIGVLVSLLLPAVNAARESGRRAQCTNNLRNLGIAVLNYTATHEAFPPASRFRFGGTFSKKNPPDPARHSMITFLLPFFEQRNVFDRFDLDFDWNDTMYSNNDANSRQHLGGILVCPSAPGGREEKHVSDYNAANRIDPTIASGLGSLIRSGVIQNRAKGSRSPDFGNWRPEWDGVMQRYAVNHASNCRNRCQDRRVVRQAHVRDGLSNTFMLFENAGKPICYQNGQFQGDCNITRFRWASSTLYMTINDSCAGGRLLNCKNNSQPYGFHPSGGNFVMADASAHFVDEAINAEVFVSLFTLAGRDLGSLD